MEEAPGEAAGGGCQDKARNVKRFPDAGPRPLGSEVESESGSIEQKDREFVPLVPHSRWRRRRGLRGLDVKQCIPPMTQF